MPSSSPIPEPSVCSPANTQPLPDFRKGRIEWIRAEIRARHQELWGTLPGLVEAPDARYAATWQHATETCMQLWVLAAELAGLEAKP